MLKGEMVWLASSPKSAGRELAPIMVREGGAKDESTTGGIVRKFCTGGCARNPWVTMAIKASPEATFVWK